MCLDVTRRLSRAARVLSGMLRSRGEHAMEEADFRIEHDSLGELRVPRAALYGAQTQRAIENFRISGLRMPRAFLRALALIKVAAAEANAELGLLDGPRAKAIVRAAKLIARGDHDGQFPIDVFQ